MAVSSQWSEILQGNVGFIGGGKMAKIICEGIIKKGPRTENLSWWKEKGANVYTEHGKLIHQCAVIFFAVKPQDFNSVMVNVYESVPLPMKPKLFISIMSGIQLEKLEKAVRGMGDSAKVIRVMLNTPIMVGEGCTVFCTGTRASFNDMEFVTNVFELFGMCKQVPESMFNAIGSLAGSGLAFIYMIMETLQDAGVKQGIPKARANEMVIQTTLGAAKMVLETRKHPAVLKDEVCSIRGPTMAGIYALESGGIRAAMFKAVEAATSGSEEFEQQDY